MRRVGWLAGLALCLGSCAPTAQERARDYNQDGVALFQRGDFAHARESFHAALDLTPQDPALLFNLAQCCDRLSDSRGAERYYSACLQRDAEHSACRHALCRLLVREGRTPEASQMVEDWLRRRPKDATAYAADGWLYRQAGDLPRAQARLQQALALEPHNPLALTELGQIYEGLGRPDRAASLYEQSLAQDAQQPDVLRRLSELRAKGVGRPKMDD
jgi:Flp pilus assembly protein TadD